MPEAQVVLLVLSSLTLFFVVVLLVSNVTTAKTAQTVHAVNRKLNLLMKHHGINTLQDLSPHAVQEVLAILQHDPRRKIEVIKRYRGLTGAGLAEAKTAVERIQEDAGLA